MQKLCQCKRNASAAAQVEQAAAHEPKGGVRSASLPILADRRRESIRGLRLTSDALCGERRMDRARWSFLLRRRIQVGTCLDCLERATCRRKPVPCLRQEFLGSAHLGRGGVQAFCRSRDAISDGRRA